ncbi:MAG: Sua5/YciO/YrdC/YwlC family protein [Campylobacterota bacterium]
MHPVILAQTDTTVGFLSQDAAKLAVIKERPLSKPFIQSFDSLKTYTEMAGRVPNRHKSRLRRSKSTTYVINNSAIRIVAEGEHHQLLAKYGWLYSTSANAKGKSFEIGFAEQKADVIVEDERGLFEGSASKIYKLNHKKIRRLR